MHYSVVFSLSIGLALASAGLTQAQTYPIKPVRIVTAGVGSSNDVTSRIIAQALGAPLGQQIIVDNRGSSVVPAQVVAQAAPDGYTLLIYGSPLWLTPLLQETSYDPLRDFSPITLAASLPLLVVVHPTLPVKSVKDLIALAKSRPNELNYASGGTGSSAYIAAELFKSMVGVKIVEVPYKSGAAQMVDLISGQVQVMFALAATSLTNVKSGRLRALAVTSAQPSALVPGLPTVAAAGVAGYESVTPQGVFAPVKTPAAIITRLHQEIVRVLTRPDVKEMLFNAGVETVGSSPEQLAASMKADMARMSKVFRAAGIGAK